MEVEISNLTLDELYESESLSKETLMFCKGYHLDDVRSIVQFYHINGDLINQLKYIHPAQAKPGDELRKVYQKYNPLIAPYTIPLKNRKDTLFIGLTELMHRENLPGWLVDKCSINGLKNLNSILSYYRTEKDFRRLKFFGAKVNEQLIELCQRFDDLEVESVVDPVEKAFESVQKLNESLSVTQTLALDNFIKLETEKLSYDKRRCLQKLLNCEYKEPDLRAILFFDDEQISSIFRIDSLTEVKLIRLKNRLKEYVDLISVPEMDENQYLNLLKIVLPDSTSWNYSHDSILSGFDFSKGFPIFKTIDCLVENKLIWTKVDGVAFRNSAEYYNDVCLKKTAKIAVELSKSRSVVVSRNSQLFYKLDKTFSFLKYIDRSIFNLYNLDESNDLIVLDDKLVNEINNTEGTHFTAQFITKIFSIIYSDTYRSIGRNADNFYYGENEWSHYYLVSLRLVKKIDIYGFVEYVAHLFSSDVIKTYTFSLKDTLKLCINAGESPDKALLDIIEFLLMNEYGLKLGKNRKLRMKKNMSLSIKEALHKLLYFSRQSIDLEHICELMYQRYQYQMSEVNRNAIIKCLDDDPLLISSVNVATRHKEWIKKTDTSEYSV